MWRILLCLSFVAMLGAQQAFANSQQAYQDYIHQYDLYRQTNNEFKIAKNEFEKFRSLTSETAALERTKSVLAQRDMVLRAYLLMLTEHLNESPGLSASERSLYQTLIRSEVQFLEQHALLIPAIGALQDTEEISKQLVSHYDILLTSIRQTIIGLSVAKVTNEAAAFDSLVQDAEILSNTYRGTLPPQKQAIIDRWLIQITNKKSLYQQKINAIKATNSQIGSIDTLDRDATFATLQRDIAEAKQYLIEGMSNLTEFATALKYAN